MREEVLADVHSIDWLLHGILNTRSDALDRERQRIFADHLIKSLGQLTVLFQARQTHKWLAIIISQALLIKCKFLLADCLICHDELEG